MLGSVDGLQRRILCMWETQLESKLDHPLSANPNEMIFCCSCVPWTWASRNQKQLTSVIVPLVFTPATSSPVRSTIYRTLQPYDVFSTSLSSSFGDSSCHTIVMTLGRVTGVIQPLKAPESQLQTFASLRLSHYKSNNTM